VLHFVLGYIFKQSKRNDSSVNEKVYFRSKF